MSSELKDKVRRWTSGGVLASTDLRELFELLLKNADDELVAEALENCTVSAESLTDLQDFAQSTNCDQAYWAATFLGRLGATANAAQACLCKLANNDAVDMAARQRAVWALQQIGTLNDETCRQLRKLDGIGNPRMQRLVDAILKQPV